MKLQQHIRHGLLTLSLIMGGMIVTPASFAHCGWHHHHGHRHHHYYRRHVRDGMIAGLAAGAIIGGIAIAASNSSTTTTYYGPSCRSVAYRRRCHFNRWGDHICRRERIVNYNC